MTFRQAIRYNLGSLTRFSCRDGLATFWLYVASIIGTTIFVAIASTVILLAGTMGRMQRYAAAHPDQAAITQGPGSYSIYIDGYHPQIALPFGPMLIGWTVLTAIVVLLLAAAVARRLHDSNLLGIWGLMPLPFLFFGLGATSYRFARFGEASEPGPGWFFLIFFNNLIYLALLVVLIVLLVRAGTAQPNRFGDRIDPPGD